VVKEEDVVVVGIVCPSSSGSCHVLDIEGGVVVVVVVLKVVVVVVLLL